MRDSDRVLEKQGPNTRHADMIRFTDEARVLELEPVIRSYLREAVGDAEAGIRPPGEQGDLELPVELSEALGVDPELAEASHKLTPGRKRSYVIDLNSAKEAFEEVDQIRNALERFAAGDADLADWLIWERSRAAGAEGVVTFDGRLGRSSEFVEP